MARKLIDQAEAARILGVTPEQVASLRDRKKLFPFRDGSEWKFKQEDVEKLRDELRDEKSTMGDEGGDWSAGAELEGVDLDLNDDLDSILLSELELGKSTTEGASTIIGKVDEGAAADIDMHSAAEVKPTFPAAGDSAITLGSGPSGAGDSEVSLAGDSGPMPDSATPPAGKGASKGDSDISLASDSGMSLAADSGFALASDVKLVPGSDAGKKAGGSSDKLFGSDALKLDDDELALIDSPSSPSKPAEGSKKMSSSSIKLGDEELEVVLGGSNIGSDVTQSPTDSGIQLISASDSGLSLDQPMTLGGSARRLLDVPDEAGANQGGGAETLQEVKAEDDFLLTAMDEGGAEESSDSGSQVIALDTDDELSSGMFAPAAGGAALLEEAPAASAGMPNLVSPAPGLGMSAGVIPATGPLEASYSGANVTVLAVCVVLLMLCGMMTFDLMRNMWSWDGAYAVNSSILESLGKTVGWLEK